MLSLKFFIKGGYDPSPDRAQVFQRALIRILQYDAEDIIPIEKPNVENERLDNHLELEEHITAGLASGNEDCITFTDEIDAEGAEVMDETWYIN